MPYGVTNRRTNPTFRRVKESGTIEAALTKGRRLRFRKTATAWDIAVYREGPMPQLRWGWFTGHSEYPETAVKDAFGRDEIKPSDYQIARYIEDRWRTEREQIGASAE